MPRPLRFLSRPLRTLALLTALLACLAPSALAQSGTLDQVSPDTGSVFGLTSTANVWQQQVRAGIDGKLSALRVTVTGDPGAVVDVRVRTGAGWTTSPSVWSGSYTKTGPGLEHALFDVSTAGISVVAGDLFVIELRGAGAVAFARGSYVDPLVGAPWYPEPLYLSGPGCFADCGWRIAFRTWVEAGSVTPYCSANPNSTGQRTLMSATGSNSIAANDLVLRAAPVVNGQPGMFLMGGTPTQQPLGPGFLCVSLPFHRLTFAFGAGGAMDWPLDLTNLPVGYAVTAGSSWYFQCWYRDPAQSPGYNLSNGLAVTFLP